MTTAVAKTKTPRKATTSTADYHEPSRSRVSADFFQEPGNVGKEVWVPIGWVYPKPTQQRTKFLQSNLNARATSFMEIGQQTAIEVMFKPLEQEDFESNPSWKEEVVELDEPPLNGAVPRIRRREVIKTDNLTVSPRPWPEIPDRPFLMVKTGETRHRARVLLQDLGKAQFIRVVLRPYVEGLQLEIEHGSENLGRNDISIADEAAYYHKLVHDYGMTVDEICDKIVGSSRRFRVVWRLKLRENLSPQLWEICKTEKLVIPVQKKSTDPVTPTVMEFSGDRLRVMAEIFSIDPLTGLEVPNHQRQNTLLARIIQDAAKTGSLMPVGKMKQLRDALAKGGATAQQRQDGGLILPSSEENGKAVKHFQDTVLLTHTRIAKLLGQERSEIGQVVPFIGARDAQALGKVLEAIARDGLALAKILSEHESSAWAEEVISESEDIPSLEDVLAQIG